MVKLIGVTHGLNITSFLGYSEKVDLYPSYELNNYISRLPKKSKIGIEWLSENDWNEVNDITRKKMGRYFETSSYWNNLINTIKFMGHKIIFLEDKTIIIKKIIDAQKELQKANQHELFIEDNESRKEYNLKLINHNEDIHNAVINYREIHEIERDKSILKKTLENNLDLAIVGVGHSDLWTYEERKRFEEYHIDKPELPEKRIFNMIFVENAEPDSGIIIENKNLIRLINLQKTGRLESNKEPDYVGTFSHTHASKNYFEVYLENENSGMIIDSLGEANITGKFLENEVEFTKKYTIAESNALKGDIKYKGSVLNSLLFNTGEIYGRFRGTSKLGEFSNIFTMTKEKISPIKLSLILANSWSKEKEHYEKFK